MKAANPIVYVVEDDESVRGSLDELIRSVGMRPKTFSSPAEFLKQLLPESPLCLVLDVRLRGMTGLDLQHELALSKRPVPIIFITGHGDIPMSVRAMKAGAIEFLTKPFKIPELRRAIKEAIGRDRRFLRRRAELAGLRRRYEQLTPREKEVMSHVVKGMLNKQIAAALGTTEITVKIQRGSMMKKMKVESVAELVRISDRLQAGVANHTKV
jgi:FixJ family two-component response regulator